MASVSKAQLSPASPAAGIDPSRIDATLRAPVLLLIASGLIWTVISGALGLISSFKLQNPGFLADCAWFTYGRTAPAALDALLYGWGVNAAIGVALLVMARLSASVLRYGNLLIVAVVFWNLGIAVGVGGILWGDSSGIELFELPSYVGLFLVVTFALFAIWVLDLFRNRSIASVYISQTYLLAAIFWFPWIVAVAHLMLNVSPVRGTAQSIVAAWYGHNLLTLGFGSVGLAVLYYLFPKVTGRAIQGYYLAPLGFWTYAIFNSWMGSYRLIGAPVPAWVQAVGSAAAFMSLVTLIIQTINLLSGIKGSAGRLGSSVALKFSSFAAASFLLSALCIVIVSVPSWGAKLNLTLFAEAQTYLAFLGFFSMAAFGAIYYFVPRLTLKAWPSAALMNAHFWGSALGVVLLAGGLAFGGIRQGAELADPSVPFAQILEGNKTYFLIRTVGLLVFTVGQLALLANFVKLVASRRADNVTAQTLFRPAPQMEMIAQ